jgi:hypothetical protein
MANIRIFIAPSFAAPHGRPRGKSKHALRGENDITSTA